MIARVIAALVAVSCIVGLGVWALQDEPASVPANSQPAASPSGRANPAASAGASATVGVNADCSDLDVDGCIETGFDPARDGLMLENSPVSGTISAAALMALFGPESVCAVVSEKGCILFPAAAQWAKQVNEAMAGGRSEGISVLAQRIFDGELSVEEFDAQATSAASLSAANPVVTGAIETGWATQFLNPVRDAAASSRLYSPSSIVQELSAGLLAGSGYTLALATPKGAHSVLPFAVHRSGEAYAVSVYDSDYPGVAQELLVDPQVERWQYAPRSASSAGAVRSGGIGTIELTPMSVRALPGSAPFDASMLALSAAARRSADMVTLLVTSPDASARVGVALTAKGRTFDASAIGAKLPKGVVARRILGSGMTGSGVSVTIDRRRVPTFAAAPLAYSPSGSQTVTAISIDSPSWPRVTVRSPKTLTADALERANLAGSRESRRDTFPLVGVSGGATYVRGAQVNLANGLNSVNLTLPDSALSMEVTMGTSGSAKLRFRSGSERVVASSTVPFDNPSGRVRVSDARVARDGRIVETSQSFARAVPIDTAVLEVLEAVAEGGTAGSSAIAISNVRRSAVAGTPIELTSNGGASTGAVRFVVAGRDCSIDGGSLIARSPTTCLVTATRAASEDRIASVSAPVTFIFRAAAQAPLVVGNPARAGTAGAPIRLTTAGGSGSGAVSFSVQGRGCSVVRNVLTASRPGTCIVTAVREASGIYSAARSRSKALVFARARQRPLTVATASPAGVIGAPVQLTAQGGSGTGSVTYQADGIGCAISGATLTATGSAPVTCRVTARREASGIYRAAESAPLDIAFTIGN